jgi:hypothetical protein
MTGDGRDIRERWKQDGGRQERNIGCVCGCLAVGHSVDECSALPCFHLVLTDRDQKLA